MDDEKVILDNNLEEKDIPTFEGEDLYEPPKKPIGNIILVIVLLAIIAVAGYFGYNKFFKKVDESVSVKEVTVELGTQVVLKPKTFLRNADNPEEYTIESDLMNDTEKYVYNMNDRTVVTKGKDYLDIGEYEIVIKAEGFNEKTKLIVTDTKAPLLTKMKSEFRYTVGEPRINFAQYFEIEDKSECSLKIDDSKVNWNKAGEYYVVLEMTDIYNNTRIKNIKVTVVEPYVEQPMDTQTDELNPYGTDGYYPVYNGGNSSNNGGHSSNNGGSNEEISGPTDDGGSGTDIDPIIPDPEPIIPEPDPVIPEPEPGYSEEG